MFPEAFILLLLYGLRVISKVTLTVSPVSIVKFPPENKAQAKRLPAVEPLVELLTMKAPAVVSVLVVILKVASVNVTLLAAELNPNVEVGLEVIPAFTNSVQLLLKGELAVSNFMFVAVLVDATCMFELGTVEEINPV